MTAASGWWYGPNLTPPPTTPKHPGTTPVLDYVTDQIGPAGIIPSQTPKQNPVGERCREISAKLKNLPGMPRIGAVLSADLYFKKDTQWAFDVPALEELVSEARLLVALLSDPGVQRIAGLLTELKDAS